MVFYILLSVEYASTKKFRSKHVGSISGSMLIALLYDSRGSIRAYARLSRVRPGIFAAVGLWGSAYAILGKMPWRLAISIFQATVWGLEYPKLRIFGRFARSHIRFPWRKAFWWTSRWRCILLPKYPQRLCIVSAQVALMELDTKVFLFRGSVFSAVSLSIEPDRNLRFSHFLNKIGGTERVNEDILGF